jgi:hypothetical protein
MLMRIKINHLKFFLEMEANKIFWHFTNSSEAQILGRIKRASQ